MVVASLGTRKGSRRRNNSPCFRHLSTESHEGTRFLQPQMDLLPREERRHEASIEKTMG